MGTTGEIPFQVSPTTKKINQPKHNIPGVRRSAIVRTHSKSYFSRLSGNKYLYAHTQMENMGILHPEYHMFFNQRITGHDSDFEGDIMAQLSHKSGLKRWGKKVRYAIPSKMKQIHMRDTFLPLHWKNMSYEQRKQTLESQLFLKKKRGGTITLITAVGGNKQRDFISKENASYPIFAT